jgi:hypothetical protein
MIVESPRHKITGRSRTGRDRLTRLPERAVGSFNNFLIAGYP